MLPGCGLCGCAQWASSSLPESVLISYDMIRPHDSFGKVMIANLKVPSTSNKGESEVNYS
jgi:hypothetical protein